MYIGYCRTCNALAEFYEDRKCLRNRYQGTTPRTCYERVMLISSIDPIGAAVLAAYRIGGMDAACAVWVDAGHPNLGSP